jgi:pimeloyl-[acyl-carrier protein] methyl ester esterase
MHALAGKRRVHAVDLPGHGHSAPLTPWTIEGAVRRLDEAFASEREPLDVLGWSLGGSVAIAWARAHPARIRRLVLVAATPKFVAGRDWPHAMARDTLARFADELTVAYRATLVRFLSLQLQGSESGRATVAALRECLFSRGEPDRAAIREALDALASADLREVAGEIEVPALVVAGDRDTLVPHAASRWLAGAMPHARLATIHGAAHVPFLSHADAFAEAAGDFLCDD